MLTLGRAEHKMRGKLVRCSQKRFDVAKVRSTVGCILLGRPYFILSTDRLSRIRSSYNLINASQRLAVQLIFPVY